MLACSFELAVNSNQSVLCCPAVSSHRTQSHARRYKKQAITGCRVPFKTFDKSALPALDSVLINQS